MYPPPHFRVENGLFVSKIILQLLPVPQKIVLKSIFVNLIVFLMDEVLSNFEKLDFMIQWSSFNGFLTF
jgi:hypothetical protein